MLHNLIIFSTFDFQYSERRYARIHSWDAASGYEVIDLEDGTSAKTLTSYVHQKDSRAKRFTYKRVEVYWPFQLLKVTETIMHCI